MEGFVLGVIASLVAAGIYAVWAGINPYQKFQDSRRSARLYDRIRTEYLADFRKKKSGLTGRTDYYFRSQEDYPETGFGAPFALLQEPQVELREFKGFLIPPLDNGRHDTNSLVEGIAPSWSEYFLALGKKALASPNSNAQRIVLFDKYLVDFVVGDTEKAIEYSEVSTDGLLSMPKSVGDVGRFAQYAVKAAFHIAEIYRFNEAFKENVRTYYVDKTNVRSNQYYDFGLYDFAGTKLVYMPHYMKDSIKTVVGDQVFLGMRSESIQEFHSDFDDLWRKCEEQKIVERQSQDDAESIEAKRASASMFSSESFHQTYYENLVQIFQTDLGWKPPRGSES